MAFCAIFSFPHTFFFVIKKDFVLLQSTMKIPQSDILTTNRLGKIFANTVATYKFFWFVSIIQIVRHGDRCRGLKN